MRLQWPENVKTTEIEGTMAAQYGKNLSAVRKLRGWKGK